MDSVKLSLRISTDVFDEELIELIEACKLDLEMSGVSKVEEDNHLARQAIKLYCRANFSNGDVKERELYNDRYYKLVSAMALCSLYESEG